MSSATKPVVEVIDYGGGNLGSLQRCLTRLEIPFVTVDGLQRHPSGKAPLILPGVGHFGAVMAQLKARALDSSIRQAAEAGVPFLGICVGLQVLFEHSVEAPDVPGLGLLGGGIVRFTGPKVPQIGWNYIEATSGKNDPPGYVYFVNSYVAKPEHPSDILYEADYYGRFCAAVRRRNIEAFQFHPEKSGAFGHQLVKNWVERATASLKGEEVA